VAINPLWHRWIYASVSNHLHVNAAAGSLEIRVELSDGESVAWKAATTKAEANITGPMSNEVSPGNHDITVAVFVAVTSDQSNSDYDHIDAVGIVCNALGQCILCIDWGATDVLEIGILTPSEAINPDHLKPKITDDQIFSTIEATFTGKFTEQ
jgi:hypothetical protein